MPRCLPDGLRARLDARRWKAPPVFGWLHEAGQVPTDDMLRTFNCGLGMIVVVASKDAARIAKVLTDAGESVHEVGAIESAPNDEADCVVDHAENAMAKLKVGILISGRGSNMAALIEAAQDADYPAEIAWW